MTSLVYLIAFLVGALSSYDLSLIGRVPLGEIIAFTAVPFLIRSWSRRSSSILERPAIVLWSVALWIGGVVLSDIFNGTPLDLFLRGVMKPVFAALWALFFVGLLGSRPNALLCVPAGAVVAAVQNYWMPRAYTADYFETGGYSATAFGLTPIIVSIGTLLTILSFRKSSLLAAGACVSTAIACAVVGAPRSVVGILMLAGAIIGYIGHRSFRLRAPVLSKRKILAVACLLVVAAYLIIQLYIFAVMSGWLGLERQTKLAWQTNNRFGVSAIGVLVGGRPQFVGSVLAIVDRPVVGYGSWAAWQMIEYFLQGVAMVGADEEYNVYRRTSGVGGSIFLVAWLENSILAMAAMTIVGYCAIKVFSKMLVSSNLLRPYIVIGLVFFAWNYWFSPFDASTRQWVGLIFALFMQPVELTDNHGSRPGAGTELLNSENRPI